MKCHYEVLNLQRNADDAEIKTAYRKLALQWHPDKNMDNPERAKEQFQFIQQAYEVLSDPHERAWYDNHREQILRGGDSGYEDNCLDVFQYFTASCYKGFGDNKDSFYAVYGDVFKTIATEDIEYMESEEDFAKIPFFGNSASDYETTVGPFYNYWMHYSTKKSYAWLCPHNIADVRHRRVLKVIEKEAKKIQQKAKKERNEAVRNLVAFVRKRDKRVKAYKEVLEEKAKQMKSKQEKMRLEQILQRQADLKKQMEENDNSFDHAYEEQLRQLENTYTDDSEYSEESEDEDCSEESEAGSVEGGAESLIKEENNTDAEDEIVDDLYCAACNKEFKSYESFENHESSKKHRFNVHKLKKSMKKDEEIFLKQKVENAVEEEVVIDEEDEIVTGISDLSGDDLKKIVETKTKQKNKKKNKSKNKMVSHIESESENEIIEKPTLDSLDEITETYDNWSNEKQNIKKIKKNKKGKKEPTPKSSAQLTNVINDDVETQDIQSLDTSSKVETKKSKQKPVVAATPIDISEIDVDHVCVTCSQQFDSKNKLFNHMKKMNHAVFIPKVASESQKKKGKKK